jgi:16S rRNA (guanine527-N7)-methyltransferase
VTDALVDRLVGGAAGLGIRLAPDQVVRLVGYLRLLERWGRAYNLTAVATAEEMVVRHLLDSLAVLPHLHGERCLDVATGAGLPGIVLAVASPGRRWVLLDSSGKRTRFCQQAVLDLGLDGVEVVRSRVEDYRPAIGFDCVTARAWAPLAEVVERTGRLVRPGGRILALKGRFPAEELRALRTSPGPVAIHRLEVPGLGAERHLVVVVRWDAGGLRPTPGG